MCYHKSLVAKYNDLMDHYTASFDPVISDLELTKERFSLLMSRDEKQEPHSKEEIKELKDLQKIIHAYTDTEYRMFHENGFDYLPSPIITAGAPDEFKLFHWGLIPFHMKTNKDAFGLRPMTLNCISEEMYEKNSFQNAVKNGQRCLIPVTGFYEWRSIGPDQKTKIPYFVSFKSRSIVSFAGVYSRWQNKETGEFYYSYAVLTTLANSLMEYVHNKAKRMPVVIPKEFEKDWLNKNLTKDDVMALCQPFNSDAMKANTISKLITTKRAETNVEEILSLHNYEAVGNDEILSEL